MNARLVVAVVGIAIAVGGTSAATSVIDSSVHRRLANSDTVDIIVRVKPTTKVAESFQEAGSTDRGAHITALTNQLKETHADALSPLTSLFSKELTSNRQVTTYWISPVATIKGATLADVEKIAALPNVLEVRESRVHKMPELTLKSASAASTVKFPSKPEWGVGKIEAPKVWALGNTGQGVRVGTIDSGVRATHEALKTNFGGAYSWFDPLFNKTEPEDNYGHGSHTMGIIAGTNGIGVAPGATWMTCRACSRGCSDDAIFACAQFMMCPTDPEGKNPDCSRAPRVVSNSWATYPNDSFYVDMIASWVKAGIIPIFATGNDGPDCGSVASPADYPNVIGVGATTEKDDVWDYSGRGNSTDGLIKPDITAPGDSIRSAYYTNDTAYKVASGSSMAAPNVAGAIVLLLEREPHLTLEQVREKLFNTTKQSGLGSSKSTCGGTSDHVFPNNQYGNGRINIFDAYEGRRSKHL